MTYSELRYRSQGIPLLVGKYNLSEEQYDWFAAIHLLFRAGHY